MAATMIEAEGLTKRFGETQALARVDLAAARGSILGVLGPNGAGKSTAVRILTTLCRPDAGTARVAGFDVVREAGEVRRRIGVTAQDATVDVALTGRQNLVMIGELSRMARRDAVRRAAELLDQFALADAADRVVKGYSGGMRRRLDLAASIVTRPPILFLDEPTTGLDPASRAAMWDVIRELRESGVTVLLTTQYLEEADQLTDRIAVIDHGRVIAEGTPAALKAQVGRQRLEVRLARSVPASVGAFDALAQSIGLIILFPLAFVSNAFVPTNNLPAWLGKIAAWNPVSAVAAAVRELWGNPNPSASIQEWPMQHPVAAALLWSLAILCVCSVVATKLFKRRTTE